MRWSRGLQWGLGLERIGIDKKDCTSPIECAFVGALSWLTWLHIGWMRPAELEGFVV